MPSSTRRSREACQRHAFLLYYKLARNNMGYKLQQHLLLISSHNDDHHVNNLNVLSSKQVVESLESTVHIMTFERGHVIIKVPV